MDDFTFPAAATAEPAEHTLCLRHRLVAFPDHFASSSPPLWFPAATPVAVVSREADMGGEEPSTLDAGRRRAEGEGEGDGDGGDDEEAVSGGGAGAGAEGEDKMDLLWENFNEELEALRRAGSCSKAAACGGLELSDTESESEPVAGRGRGCAPMLMASSRAGGTGHYRRTGSWVLLMRIFRRLFVVEKTISAARRRHGRAP